MEMQREKDFKLTEANNKFDEDTIPTIGFNFRKLKKGKVEFKLWDLGKYIIHLHKRRST